MATDDVRALHIGLDNAKHALADVRGHVRGEAQRRVDWAIGAAEAILCLFPSDPSLHTWDGPAPTAIRDAAGQLVDDPLERGE